MNNTDNIRIAKKSIGKREVIFPCPVMIIGTYDAAGKPNAAAFAWGGTACSDPPAVSVAVRKSRYTYDALMHRRAFTVNLPTAQYAKEADYFGIASGRNEDKFAVTGLTPVLGDKVDAPYIAEFPYNMECSVRHIIDLGAHTLFIGEVVNVSVTDTFADKNGRFKWENILTFDSAEGCYRTPGDFVAKAFSAGLEYKK
jgi:flavin reductase (DIM6/NTAB) family NADH-FMN oxidoreductase RutF